MMIISNVRVGALFSGVLGLLAPSISLANDNAEPACDMEIIQGASVDWKGLRGRGYEIFDPTRTYEAFEITLRHSGSACRFQVAFIPQTGAPSLTGGGGGALEYDLLSAPNGRSIVSQGYGGTDSTVISGEAAAGDGELTLPLYLTIPPGQRARSSYYQGGAIARLFVIGQNELAYPVSEALVSFSAYVPGQVRTRLDGQSNGGSLNIDFGDLRYSPSRSLEFYVAANADVAIALSSLNHGNLMHQSGVLGIPYQVRVGDVDLSLVGATPIPLSTTDPVYEATLPMTFTLGKVNGNLVAGAYHDTLTVIIRPL